jgi:hypothetical protein
MPGYSTGHFFYFRQSHRFVIYTLILNANRKTQIHKYHH